MAVTTVSSLSESFASGAPEEFTNGQTHKPKGDVSPSDEPKEQAESDVIGPDDDARRKAVTDDDHDDQETLRREAETQKP
jgi:hypothetical protein